MSAYIVCFYSVSSYSRKYIYSCSAPALATATRCLRHFLFFSVLLFVLFCSALFCSVLYLLDSVLFSIVLSIREVTMVCARVLPSLCSGGVEGSDQLHASAMLVCELVKGGWVGRFVWARRVEEI